MAETKANAGQVLYTALNHPHLKSQFYGKEFTGKAGTYTYTLDFEEWKNLLEGDDCKPRSPEEQDDFRYGKNVRNKGFKEASGMPDIQSDFEIPLKHVFEETFGESVARGLARNPIFKDFIDEIREFDIDRSKIERESEYRKSHY